VHRRGIDLDLAVLRIHTIDIFRTEKHSGEIRIALVSYVPNVTLKRHVYVNLVDFGLTLLKRNLMLHLRGCTIYYV